MRLFVAVQVPDALKPRLIEASMELSKFGIKPVKENQMHITISFMGGVDPKYIDDVISAFHSINHGKFECSISGIGTFAGKVVFAKIKSGMDDLKRMHIAFSENLRRGIEAGNKVYHPHLTLGRATPSVEIENVLGFVRSNSEFEIGSFICNEIKLYSSEEVAAGRLHKQIAYKTLG